MRIIAISACVAAVSLTMGCASILNEDTQQVNVTSSTGKAIKGTVDGKPFKAPGIVSLTRAKAAKILITETDGCVKETLLDSKVDNKFFINILTGGTFGSSTDYSTEKMWKYSDDIIVSCQ